MTLTGWLLALVALFGWRRQYLATVHWRDMAEAWRHTADCWHALKDALEDELAHR